MTSWQAHRLPSGATITLTNVPGAAASVAVSWSLGYRDETWPDQGGLAHLREHLTFRASARSADLEDEVLAEGGTVNGYTRRDLTVVHADGYGLDLPPLLGLAAEWLRGNHTDAWVSIQRDVVREEIREKTGDRPESFYPWAHVGRCLWEGYALGHDGWATAPEGPALARRVRQFRKMYTADRLTVAVAWDHRGGPSPDAVLATLADAVAAVPVSRSPTLRPAEAVRRRPCSPSLALLTDTEHGHRGPPAFAGVLPSALPLTTVLAVEAFLRAEAATGAIAYGHVGEYGNPLEIADPITVVIGPGTRSLAARGAVRLELDRLLHGLTAVRNGPAAARTGAVRAAVTASRDPRVDTRADWSAELATARELMSTMALVPVHA
ncbi:insulinase family protein [Dactylosporangium sp. CA-139114]|uniref:insulinase family protein n=1 Tax=Dactylosporangium sp. CA-139114 TaxID=3239931 RepID=UPI003D978E04